MARGLAQVAALALARQGATALVEINPHAVPERHARRESAQRHAAADRDHPEIANRRPFVIVLIDEVESFAVRRSGRVLRGPTRSTSTAPRCGPARHRRDLARNLPSVLFVTTTNFIEAVDEAFLSRADLVMKFSLPDRDTIGKILEHALGELAVQWPALLPMTQNGRSWGSWRRCCDGWDGRRIRKLVLAALAQRLDVARDPSILSWTICSPPRVRRRRGVGRRHSADVA
jgi:AAA+ superfamily predicted ATPase